MPGEVNRTVSPLERRQVRPELLAVISPDSHIDNPELRVLRAAVVVSSDYLSVVLLFGPLLFLLGVRLLRDVGDPAAVGRPGKRSDALLVMGESFCFAAVDWESRRPVVSRTGSRGMPAPSHRAASGAGSPTHERL